MSATSLTAAITEMARSLCRRLMILPRICKRWANVLTLPSAIWDHIDIGVQELRGRGRPREPGLLLLDARVMSTWFSRSGPYARLPIRYRQNVQSRSQYVEQVTHRCVDAGAPAVCGSCSSRMAGPGSDRAVTLLSCQQRSLRPSLAANAAVLVRCASWPRTWECEAPT